MARRAPAKKLPKATPVDVTGVRREIDYERLGERVKMVESHVNDHGRRIAQVEGSADYWAGLSVRVKTLEDKPDVVPVVQRAGGVDIAWCFVLYTIVMGLLGGCGYWYWSAFGWHLPAGWL